MADTAEETAKAKAKPKPKAANKPAPAKSAGDKAQAPSYAGHKEGSRKGKVHALYDQQGAQAAWMLGQKLGLKQSTLRSWFAFWARAAAEGGKGNTTRADVKVAEPAA